MSLKRKRSNLEPVQLQLKATLSLSFTEMLKNLSSDTPSLVTTGWLFLRGQYRKRSNLTNVAALIHLHKLLESLKSKSGNKSQLSEIETQLERHLQKQHEFKELHGCSQSAHKVICSHHHCRG